VSELGDAIRQVERESPLPRCGHGSCLVDGAGKLLEPECGCRQCEFSIARQFGNADGETVRIEVAAGARLLGRIEVSLKDFAAAVMGSSGRTAVFSVKRVTPADRKAASPKQTGAT
jgi:hypothetical protein